MIIFAVAGGGEVSEDAIDDLLSDWLGIDTNEEREFRAYLPADRKATSITVQRVAEWLVDLGYAYTSIDSGQPGRAGRMVNHNAEDTIECDGDIVAKIIEVLLDAQNWGDEPYLLLAWGEDAEQAPDEITAQLLDAALKAGIPVLDLSMGLEDLSYADDKGEEEVEEGAAEQEEQAAAAEEPTITGELTEEEVELTEDEPVDDAQATPAPEPQEQVPDLVTTLGEVYQALTALDRFTSAMRGEPYTQSPLTLNVRHHLRALMNASGQLEQAKQTVMESLAEAERKAEETKTRGKPRDIASDEVTVLHDPEKRTIRLQEGPGRPRRGEMRQKMTRDEYEKLRAEYEAA